MEVFVPRVLSLTEVEIPLGGDEIFHRPKVFPPLCYDMIERHKLNLCIKYGQKLSQNLNILRMFSSNATSSVANGNDTSVSQSLINWANAKPYYDIPSEMDIPIFGTMWIFLPLIGRYHGATKLNTTHEKLYKKFGPIVRFEYKLEKNPHIVFVYEPNAIEAMFRNEGKYPIRQAFNAFGRYRELNDEYFSKGGILVMNGQNWGEFRSKVQPYLMKPDAITNYLPSMNIAANEFVAKMSKVKNQNGEIDNYMNELYKWALESLSMVTLDTKLGLINDNGKDLKRAKRMIENISVMFEESWILEFQVVPLWRWFKNPLSRRWRRFSKAHTEFIQLAMEYIKDAKERIEMGEFSNDEPSILQQLLSRPDFDIKDAITMALDLLFAGVDTTSHTVAFLLYHLAKNPKEQEILYQEICTVVGNSTEITKSMTNELRYLKACIKESLRITPTVSGTPRTLDHDIAILGYQIPANTQILGINYIPCRDEKYFPDPLSFKPERWLKGSKTSETHPFLLLPFGFGPRMCIGRRIAEQEYWLLISKIIQKFKIQYHYEDFGISTKIVNVPDKPLKFKFIERN